MDAILTDRDLGYDNLPPVLIVGTSDSAIAKAAHSVDAAGLRIADRVPIASAGERIARQAAASALWIELDGDGGAQMDRLLEDVRSEVRDGRYRAIVAAPAGMLDTLQSSIAVDGIDLLIDADDCERAAALSLAVELRGDGHRLHDAASDRNAARLRQLSDEISRIASTLARLSTGPATAPRRPEIAPAADLPDVNVDTVRAVIRARRLRSRYFQEDLFADPAWDMLLDLLQAELSQLRVPVSSLCIAAAVPATTALRWLKTMVQEGLFVRRADPHDGRRVFVELAPETSQALRRYFAEVGKVAVI